MSKYFKGFNKDLQCNPNGKSFQYKIGESYEENSANVCSNGFHSCENPFDVWNYYSLENGNRFTEVEIDGKISKNSDGDTKISSSKIKIGKELSLKEFIEAGVNFIFEELKASKENGATTGVCANSATTGEYANSATTGEYANSATTGDSANSATTGDRSNSATTGVCANSAVNGTNSIASATGINSRVKGNLGCFIVCAEWVQDEECNWIPKNGRFSKVDGKKIKANVWYKVENNKWVECE